jgi:hypothetical protein
MIVSLHEFLEVLVTGENAVVTIKPISNDVELATFLDALTSSTLWLLN